LKAIPVHDTHDQIAAMPMADKIVVVRAGHIAKAGTPLSLYDRPASTFVATFIVSPAMSLFDGKIEHGDFVLKARTGQAAVAALAPIGNDPVPRT